MPGVTASRGRSFGTSSRSSFGTSRASSSTANGGMDMKMKAVLVKGLKLLGENFNFEEPGKNCNCKLLLEMYKECVEDYNFNCRYYLRNCPDYNNNEFLRTLSAAKSKSNGP